MNVRYEGTDKEGVVAVYFTYEDGREERLTINITRERGYSDLPGGEPHRAFYEVVANFLSNSSGQVKVLDGACGSGYGTEILMKAGELWGGHDVIGVDISEEAIEYARRRHPGCSFVVSPVENLHFADGYFDVIVSVETIEHIEDDDKAIRGFRRMLDDGGLLFISTPVTWEGKDISPYHLREYTRDEFTDLIERNGFTVIERLIDGESEEGAFYFYCCGKDAVAEQIAA